MVCVSIARKIVNRVKTDIKSIKKTFKPFFSIIVYIFFVYRAAVLSSVTKQCVTVFMVLEKKYVYIYKCKYRERETL